MVNFDLEFNQNYSERFSLTEFDIQIQNFKFRKTNLYEFEQIRPSLPAIDGIFKFSHKIERKKTKTNLSHH